MKLKTFLFDDESGVSPVIGVILMVAITVILAAVIATFVLGLGEQISSTAPQASFTYSYSSDTLTITHAGGETLKSSNVEVQTSDGDVNNWGVSDISAGDSVTIDSINSDATVQIIWNSPEGDQSAILSEWNA